MTDTPPIQSASASRWKTVLWIVATVMAPVLISAVCTSFYIGAWFAQQAIAGAPHPKQPPTEIIQRGVMIGAPVGVWFTVGLWWLLNRKRDSFSTLFNTRTQTFGKDAALGLLLGAAWVLVYGLIGWPPFSAMSRFDSAKLFSIPTSLSAGFCEEFLFRGFVILLIARAGGGRKAQLLWSSLAFGLAHVMWGPVGMLFTMLLGASFAAVTLWRGNVWTAVVAHTVLDLCIEPGLLEKAMSYRYS